MARDTESGWNRGGRVTIVGTALDPVEISNNQAGADTAVDILLAEQWLIEVDVPANQRRVNSRKAFLVNVSTSEHEGLRQGGTLPPERMAIPDSWHKGNSTRSETAKASQNT